MTWNIFQSIYSQVDGPLLAAIRALVANMEAAVATILVTCLTIYVALSGYMILFGRGSEPVMLIAERFIKGAAVAFFLQAAAYDTYVTNFVLTALPGAIASAVSGTTTVGAQAFDHIWNVAFAGALAVIKNLGWTDIGLWILVAIYLLIAAISCAYGFMVWLASHIILGLFVIVGPLAILGFLFGPTRALFERWIGAVLSVLFLQLFVTATLSVILAAENSLLTKIQANADNSIAQIQVLFAAIILFLVAYDVVKQLPGVATALAGGLYFHANTIGRATFGAAVSYASAAFSGARSAAAGAGHAAQTRLNARAPRAHPAPGPSLSGATP